MTKLYIDIDKFEKLNLKVNCFDTCKPNFIRSKIHFYII